MLMSMILLAALQIHSPPLQIKLTGEEYPTLYLAVSLAWNEWHHSQEGWFIFLDGVSNEDKGVRILQWKKDNLLSLVGSTTGREGVTSLASALVNPKGDLILIKGLMNPSIYCFTPHKAYPFERVASLDQLDDMTILEDTPIYGSQHSQDKLGLIFEKGPSISLKDHIAGLPKDTRHPVQDEINFNPMILSADGNRLAVGFALLNEVTVFIGKKSTTIPLRFPGRIPPPKDLKLPANVKNPYNEWLAGFHRLNRLAWFKGELYGYFRQGFIDSGIWVRLIKDGKPFTWNNNKQETQIIALADDEVVLGQKQEDEDGEVTWRLWRSSSLP